MMRTAVVFSLIMRCEREIHDAVAALMSAMRNHREELAQRGLRDVYDVGVRLGQQGRDGGDDATH
jgi:hypothetical protein